jgi:hypothetical protein
LCSNVRKWVSDLRWSLLSIYSKVQVTDPCLLLLGSAQIFKIGYQTSKGVCYLSAQKRSKTHTCVLPAWLCSKHPKLVFRLWINSFPYLLKDREDGFMFVAS